MAGASQSRAPDSTKYVEYEEYVDFQLEKTRGIVKRTDILTTLMALAVGVIGYLLAFVVFDQWIIEGGFGYASRIVLLSVVGAVVVGTLAWRVVLPLLRHVNPLYAARVIEQSDPKLKSNLVNFVDVKLANAESSPSVLKSMQKRAAVELSHIDVEEAVDHRPLLRIAYVLLGVVIVSALYIFLSPKNVFVSVRRALLPTSSVAVATRTTITAVDPGDKDVPARTRQMISAEVYGEEAEQAQILFTTADHKYVDEPVKMRRESPGLSKFIGELNGENGKGLLQSLTYRIVAGDARSTDYTINVIQPPSARVDEVHYVFPKYTELPEKTASGGDIDGWEGTIVTVKATANMKVASARIVLTDSDEKAEKGEEISMQVTDGTQLSGTWKLEFRSDGTSPRYYHLRVRTENQKKDDIDSDPTQYALRIRADQRPDVALLDPTGDLTKPANGIIPLIVQATDPDFKIRSVMLRGTRGADSLFSRDEKLFDDELPARSVTGRYNFKLEPLGLKPGERIQIWIEAKDNKHPTANRTNTTPINVTIEKPASAEEVQQQLAKDEQHQQEQLERANDANKSDSQDKEPSESLVGDKRDEPQKPGKERPEVGASQPKDNEEPGNEDDRNRAFKEDKNGTDRAQKPANNDEALSKLLRKQPAPDQAEQNPKENEEPPVAPEENPADRPQQERGEGQGQKGQGQSKQQKQAKSDQSQSDRGEADQNSNTGERQGNQSKAGNDDSASDGGEGSNNASKKTKGSANQRQQPPAGEQDQTGEKSNDAPKNAKDKSQPMPGVEGSEPGTEPGDKPKPGEKSNSKTKKPAAEENPTENAAGDEQKPGGKGGSQKDDKTQDKNKSGTGDNPAESDPAMKMKKSAKEKPSGNDADQREPGDANSTKDDNGQKKAATKNQNKNDDGNTDSQQPDGGAGQPKKDKSDKNKNAADQGGETGDEQKPGDPAEQKKPGAKPEGSGEEGQTPDGEKDPKQMNKEQGGADKKAADKSEAGGGKDDKQSPGTPGQSNKDEAGEPSGDDGQGGDKAPKNGTGPKKSGSDSDPKGPEKPAEDDGTAKDKPATGNEQGEATGEEGQGDRETPRAGENVKKKDGSGQGAKKPGKSDDPQRQKANPKRPADEGSEGGTDDAEHAERAPDDKKAPENPGKVDQPPSEKGVERRKEDSETRPSQNTEGGNQKMEGQGRKKGQKSEQSDAGEQGSGNASDQGKPGANKAGPGDKSDEPGNTDPANKETGQPGSKQKGKGSSTKPSNDNDGQQQDAPGENPGDKGAGQKGQKAKGAKGGKPGQGDEAGEASDDQHAGKSGDKQSGKPGGKPSGDAGKDSGNDAGGQKGTGKSSQPGKPGAGGPQQSGGGVSSAPGQGDQPGGDPNDAQDDRAEPRDRATTEPTTAEQEAVNLENAKKATNLVLKRLKSQLERGEVDQEMLDEMGWKGKQDVEKFVRYLEDNLKQNADDNSPDAEARRMQFEETLRHLNVGSDTQRRSGSVGKERAIEQIGTKNVPPPREYEKIWQSYTRSLSKQGEKNEPKSKAADKAATGKTNTDKSKKPNGK